MDKRLKDLRSRMIDTKAVTFDHTHKDHIRRRIKETSISRFNLINSLQNFFPIALTYLTLLFLVVSTGLFAASEVGLVPKNSSVSINEHSLTKEMLYENVLASAEMIDIQKDQEKVRSIALSYLENQRNWKITNHSATYGTHSTVLVQGKITEGYFEKMTFSIWIEPETGLPLNFVIRNQESSVLEQFKLPDETLAHAERQK
ncbi:hypothetical protein IQ283_05735 [Alkalihalobacillus hwajinpoensis]|uniref:hypothetical protein n=1 Tax=Guptibacillus hwajinpoensis TaxID=208199 RepID=UPI0018835D81|nr:hypothetical protein [Pseudalkalibacillus hwajinpoensis]MBF0706104.1 hypothetical protein [Pseudalkalibacillus hwajinpoensis]